MTTTPRTLVVLDTDSGFVRVLAKRAEDSGWRVRRLASAVRIETMIALRAHAAVVDPTALGRSAWSYLESLVAELPALAVVICSQPSSVAQRVRGLRLGADDWVTKPCHAEGVLARVDAVLRRHRRTDASHSREAIVAGELEIRPDQFQAFAAGVSADLTRREYELLRHLAMSEGLVLAREAIYGRVWGYGRLEVPMRLEGTGDWRRKLGFSVDTDARLTKDFRVVQLTPPGRAARSS